MPALRSPQDMLVAELKNIYSAERQLSRILPRVAKKSGSERLREMLQQRVEQGATLIEQIDEALEEMHVSKGRQKNVAAEGLIEDMNQHLEEAEDETLRDPLLIAGVQKIEHYCIAAWGTAGAMGRLLGADKVVKTMEQVLSQGKEFDEEMTRLAEDEVNPQMLDGDDGEEEEQQGSGKKAGSRRRSH